MSLKNYTHEELTDMAMVELANVILEDANKALDFREVFNKLAELKRYTEEQKHDLLAQFYTELNIDGRFLTLGSDKWGLKRWYPVDQIDEQVVAEPKKKKKSNKKKSKKEKDKEQAEEKELDVTEENVDKITKDSEAILEDDDQESPLEEDDKESPIEGGWDDEGFDDDEEEYEEDDETEENAE